MNLSLLSANTPLSLPIDLLIQLPFFNSFITLNGKDYLSSLLNITQNRTISPSESIKLSNSSSSFFIYIKGNIELLNSSNGKVIEKEIEPGTPISYSRKSLYDQITVKINTPSLFLEIRSDEYNTLLNTIIIDKTQRLLKFISTLKAFPYFQRSKKALYEKLYQIAEEREYKRDDRVYEESNEVDGIYLIIKGSFLLSKRKPLYTKEEEIRRLDKEICSLTNEGKILMKCLNGKYGYNSNTMSEYKMFRKTRHLRSFGLDNDNFLLTKCPVNEINLIVMNEHNIFGDFELILKEGKRSYTVRCSSEIGKVIYFPIGKFREVCNEAIMRKIYSDVMKKGKLMTKKYHSDMNIAERKCNVRNVVDVSVNTDDYVLDRNNMNRHKTWNGHNVTIRIIKTLKPICNISESIGLHKGLKGLVLNRKDKEKEIGLSKSFNSTIKSKHQLIRNLGNKTKHNQSHLMSFKDSIGNVSQNIQDEERSSHTSNYYPFNSEQNYLSTGIKYPSTITHHKKKLIFHFNDNKKNLKNLILKNNLREITLGIRN